MTDPRKPVFRPDVDRQKTILTEVHKHLLAVTAVGARAIGATGASFVIIGMGVWAAEFAEIDGRAAAKYLRALADINDPAATESQKRHAEKERLQAASALFAAIDIEMAEAKGHG